MEKELTKDIMKLFETLPDQTQMVFAWAIKNLDLVKAICKESDMTSEEIEHYLEIARKKNDDYLGVLLTFKKVYDKEDTEVP